MGVDGSADLVDVGAVTTDKLMELVARYAELFGPVGDIGRHFGVDLLGVMRSLGGVVFFDDVGLVDFGIVAVLGHRVVPL
jgi:hypothetical protein